MNSVSLLKPKIKVGYLGGGQLAQMLALSATRLGLEPHVLSESNTDPAALVTSFWKKGNLQSTKSLKKFIESVDVVTFESEFLDAKKIILIQAETKKPLYPSPQIMELLQDRKSQKELLDQFQLKTAPWVLADSKKSIDSFIRSHSFPVVFKQRHFGYDGYGTFILSNQKQLSLFLSEKWSSQKFIVEKFIPFKKEVAVLVARSLDKSMTHFPFVESQQKEARCDWVKGPITVKEQKKLIQKLQIFLKKINYVGVMGLEFFMTHNELVINEIAPRVHNTGHYSLDTDCLSQFDVHNMCLLGLKLPQEIKLKNGFAMVNLIGSTKAVQLKASSGLHWYGKIDNRKGRKMGHINALGLTPNEALKKALKLRGEIKL